MSALHEEGRLNGERELELYWQAWKPEGDPKAVVVLAHGASEHSGRYEHVGERFAAAGYPVYALDHRGHGRSEGRRAYIERMELIVSDFNAFVGMSAARHEGKKVFVLGHSMGGAVVLAYALRHQADVDGMVLSAPVAAIEAASPVTRALGATLSVLAPRLGIYGVDSAGVSRDPAVVRAYDADPLVFHDKLPARTVAELTGEVARFHDEVPTLTLPLLAMHGDADTLAPLEGSRMVEERAGSSDKTLEVLEGLFHEILNEPEQEQVMERMIGWLDERAA